MRRIFLGLLILTSGLLLQPAKAATLLASGNVTVNNAAVTAGWVELTGNNHFAGAEINSNGQYSIYDPADQVWPSGTYDLRVMPDTALYPQNSPSTTAVQLTSGQPLNQNLSLNSAAKQIQITVQNGDGSPADITVKVKASGGGSGMFFMQSTQNGQANFTVRPDGAPYKITFDNCRPQNDNSQSCVPWIYTGEPIEVIFDLPADTNETEQITVQGETPSATVTGHITYQGQGFRGIINLYNSDNLFSGWMDDNGDFLVYAQPGAYKIDLMPQQTPENMDVVRYYIDQETINGALEIKVGSNDVGELAASYENSNVMATVQDEAGNPLEGMMVNVWLAGGGEWRQVGVMPGSNGRAGSEGHPGTYYISAFDPAGAYFPTAAKEIILGENEEQATTLTMVRANATANFTINYEDGSRASDFNSFVNCWDETNQRSNGIAIVRGSGSLALAAGTYNCQMITPQNAGYSMAPTTVTIDANETQDATVELTPHDAIVSGTLLDQNNDAIVPTNEMEPLKVVLEGEVFGRFETEVNTDGSWSAALPPDTYSVTGLGTEVIPAVGKQAANVTVASGETKDDRNIEMFAPDSTITASVFEPDGETPLAFALVTCSYLPEGDKGDFAGGRVIEVNGETDENGEASIPVVSQDGNVPLTYNCNVAVPETADYIAPAIEEVKPGKKTEFTVQETDSTITVEYQAKEADLTIVECQAWAQDGSGMVTAEDDNNDGSVELPVSSKADDTWNVSCAGVEDAKWFTPTTPVEVTLNNKGEVATDVTLKESEQAVPEGSSASFDGSTERSLVLEDVSLSIPANTVESDDDATVTVTPMATSLPTTEDNSLLGVPVNLQAFDSDGKIQTSFSEPVTVTLPYNESVLANAGVLETDLAPKFFDEAGGTWEAMTGFRVDTEANTITFDTNHFSQFALVYNNRVAGSEPAKVKNLNAPKNKIKTNKATITWKKLGTAAAYELRLFNSKNKKIHTFKELTKASYQIKKYLTARKKYKVRVRAIGNNGLYGQWSNYLAFRTKMAE